MKKLLRFLIVLSLLGTFAFFAKKRFSPTTTDAPLTLFGNVDIRQVALGFRTSGRVATMAFEEGAEIAEGQVLASLDTGPLEDNLTLFKTQLAVAEATLAKLEAGTRPGEVAQARATVEERQTALANAQQLLTRQLELAKTGAVSKQAADDAQAQMDASLARLQAAKEALALAEEGPRPEDLAIARAEVDATRAKVAQAERQLDDATLKAPSNGVILTRVQEPGAIVATGASVYTLALTSPVWVRTYVSEPELGHIHPGMKASIQTDSRPNHPYDGTIGFISPIAEFTPKSVETSELRTQLVYRLRVIIANPDAFLRQGMPVTVRFPDEPNQLP